MTNSATPPTDTIVAQATPTGRGGIAIIRISGPQVKLAIQELIQKELNPRHALYTPFHDANGTVIDEGVAIYFPQPNSFTGEEVMELHGHGGPVVVDMLLKRILNLGIRLARPGEFSERAFLNGKMDLAQAEAVADLIDASSQQAARSAIRSLQGEFSKQIHAINEQLIHLRMYIEAAIDFTDEEIDFLSDDKLIQQLNHAIADLTDIQAKAKQGSLLREGLRVVIAGQPNVGKSSLLNHISGKEIAIVTDIPGTTRDVLRSEIQIDGMPLHIIDTAGLRESADRVEQEGIRRAHEEIQQADLLLYVIDATRHNNSDEVKIKEYSSAITILIRNKIDLTNEQPSIQEHHHQTIISLSAKSGLGMSLLKSHIKQKAGYQNEPEGLFLARRRHLDALTRAAQHMHAAKIQLTTTRSGELAAEDLRLAMIALCEITGEFSADDLLGRIFGSFCIGK